jgi:hypothetical protein
MAGTQHIPATLRRYFRWEETLTNASYRAGCTGTLGKDHRPLPWSMVRVGWLW